MFYLGAPDPSWLEKAHVPIFVSANRTIDRKRGYEARVPWALDSGGFTQVSKHGKWLTTKESYVEEVLRVTGWGKLQWVAPQDWMCEPEVLQKTGLTVTEHQIRTTDSVVYLKSKGLPAIPVLQGWEEDDYWRHVDQYEARGISLEREPTVGIGSVCRRKRISVVSSLIKDLRELGIRLHGFGVKVTGLREFGDFLASADSMAWSFKARVEKLRLPQCTTHKNCANCLLFAEQWVAGLPEVGKSWSRALESSGLTSDIECLGMKVNAPTSMGTGTPYI